jgi:hypothetical protein
VTSAAILAAAVTKLLTDDAAMASLQTGAHKALDKLSGALSKTLAALLEFLPEAKPSDVASASTSDDLTRLQRVS